MHKILFFCLQVQYGKVRVCLRCDDGACACLDTSATGYARRRQAHAQHNPHAFFAHEQFVDNGAEQKHATPPQTAYYAAPGKTTDDFLKAETQAQHREHGGITNKAARPGHEFSADERQRPQHGYADGAEYAPHDLRLPREHLFCPTIFTKSSAGMNTAKFLSPTP